LNAQELGKFVCYRDAILLSPICEGRGRVHTFTPWHEYTDGAPLRNGARWQGKAIRISGGVNGGYVDTHYLGPLCRLHGAWMRYTVATMFKTSTDVLTSQFIYEEGGGINGLNIYIRDGKVFCGEWINVDEANAGNAKYSFLAMKINLNKKYFIANVFEAYKRHSAFLNYIKHAEVTISWRMLPHGGTCQFGRSSGDTVTDISAQTERGYGIRDSFNGLLFGLFIWEKALNDSEVKSACYYATKKPKPTCVTRRGVYQAVKNTGIEVDGNLVRCTEAMV